MPVNTELALPRYADQILASDAAGLSNSVLLTVGLDAPKDDDEIVILRPRLDRPGLGTRMLAVFYCLPLAGRAVRQAHEAVVRYKHGCALAENFQRTIAAVLECRDDAPGHGEAVPLLARHVACLAPEGRLLTVGEAAKLVRRARAHITGSNEEKLAEALFSGGNRASRLERWMLPSMRNCWNVDAPLTRDFFLVATLEAARAKAGFASRVLTPGEVDECCAHGAALYEAVREALPGARLDAQCLEGLVVRGRGLREQGGNLVADIQARLAQRSSALDEERTARGGLDEGVQAALEQRKDLNPDARGAFRDLATALPLAPILVDPCLQMVEEATDELSRFGAAARAGVAPPADVCERARAALDRGLAAIADAASAAGLAFDPEANRAWACELCARVGCANEGFLHMGALNLQVQRHFQQYVLGTPATA
jgi:hypothetical protein